VIIKKENLQLTNVDREYSATWFRFNFQPERAPHK